VMEDYRITPHVYSCICMPMPIDVCSVDVPFLEENTRTHCHTRALALTHVRRHCVGRESTPDCFLPPTHRSLYLNNNSQLTALPADLFSGLSSLT
jgi:hypothetical protein